MPGHVDVLVEFPLPVRLSMLVEKLKGRSLRLWRAVFAGRRRLPGLWSPSWLVSTVGGAPRGVVGRCVENQKAVA